MSFTLSDQLHQLWTGPCLLSEQIIGLKPKLGRSDCFILRVQLVMECRLEAIERIINKLFHTSHSSKLN